MNFIGHLKFAARMLAKNQSQTALAILTLAVGIGANTAVFSVFKAVVLDPFPYPEADRLVEVWSRAGENWWRQPQSTPNYLDVKNESKSFEELGAYTTRVYNVSDRELTAVQGVAATAGVLRAFGVEPAIGRVFTEAEEQEGNQHVVVLSHGLWKRLWAGDPAVVGRSIRLNGENHEVLGVMPESFEFHSPWFRGSAFELWTPLVLSPNAYRGSYSLLSIGRLKSGVHWRAAQAEIESIAASLAERYPDTNYNTNFWVVPFDEEILGGVVGRLVLLLLTVGLVLLMACSNVAAILLARGAARQTEVAIRVSLGASPKHILGQFLTESLLLSLVGAVAGVLLAMWGLDALRQLLPPTMPRTERIGIDSGVLLFTLIASGVTAILSGLVPARTAARTGVVEALKEGGGSHAGARDRNRSLRIIAVAQLALALVMMNSAILLFSSYRNLVKTELGFNTEHLLAVEMWLAGPRLATPEDRVRFAERLRENVSGLPGVERAEVTTKIPFEGGRNGEILTEEQAFEHGANRPLAEWSYVSPGYFEALGIPLIAGRTLARQDENPSEYGVVVNRRLVERCWPDGNALGKRLRVNAAEPRWRAIVVGVVGDVRQQGAERRPMPEIFFPYMAEPRPKTILIVRSRFEPLRLVSAVQKEVKTLEPDLALAQTRTMDSVFVDATRHRRFVTLLLDLFSAIALVLAVAGIYGTLSYQVAQRTHEFGVRLALGASRSALLGLVLRQTARFLVPGLFFGLAAAINAAFLLRSLLYGVSPLNLFVLLCGVLLVGTAAFLASLLPALRACCVNPVQALRME